MGVDLQVRLEILRRGQEILRQRREILQGSGSLSDGFHETLGQQVAGKEFGQVPGVVVVVLVDVAEEVDEPVVDVDPGGLAAAHRGVHHGGVQSASNNQPSSSSVGLYVSAVLFAPS